MCICICVYYVCVPITAGGWWGKRVTVITPCAWCGAKPLASINLDACVCARVHVRVCVTERESPASAGMEMSLVMHLPLSLVPDSLSHPCIAHVCRLLPILHPSLSLLPTSLLHPQPPSIPPSETKTKSHCKLLQYDFEAVVQTRQCYIAVCVIWADSSLNCCTSRVALQIVIIKRVACLPHYPK